MKQNSATTTNKGTPLEAQNELEHVHKMTLCPEEWILSTTQETKNKTHIIQSNKTEQTNNEG